MESKRSCCSPTSCCGIPVETGCFIFSVMNLVICCLASIGGLVFLIFMFYTWFDGEPRGSNDMVLVYLFTGIAAACAVGSAIALTFAVILFLGVRKNNTRYVMSYLVYGIITLTLSVLGTLGFIWMEWGEKEFMAYGMISLLVCVIYSGLLMLVYQTYVVLSEPERSPVIGYKRLLNTSDC